MTMTERSSDEQSARTAGVLLGSTGLLAAVAWHRTGPVEQLAVCRVAPVLAERLGLLHDLAVAAGHDLDGFGATV